MTPDRTLILDRWLLTGAGLMDPETFYPRCRNGHTLDAETLAFRRGMRRGRPRMWRECRACRRQEPKPDA